VELLPGTANVEHRGDDRQGDAGPEEPQRPVGGVARDDPEGDAGVEEPGGGLSGQVDVEVDPARDEQPGAGEEEPVAGG
jgi:hypothetical protein